MISCFENLKKWSDQNFSYLPWRKRRSLYRTLVSEIMLQQTTVGTVLKHFERFLEEFPTLESLASSTEEEVLIAWKGLGYYRRVKNLRKACQFIQRELGGKIPDNREELLKIPGIGPYTSSALIAIGRNKKEVAIDANLERVLARYYGLGERKGAKLQKYLRDYSMEQPFWGVISARELNESLMDLGRQVCQARKVNCPICPLKLTCRAYKMGRMLDFPLVIKKKDDKHDLVLLRLVGQKGNKVLAYKKSEKEWLAGQYEVPTFIISSTDKKLTQYPSLPMGFQSFSRSDFFKTSITKYKITNYLLEVEDIDNFPRELKWLEPEEQRNLSTGSLKALKRAKTSKSIKNQEEG